MIVLPNGTIYITTAFETYKKQVDSTTGNPVAHLSMEVYPCRSDLINSANMDEDYFNVSGMCDFSLYAKTFNEIEQWMVGHMEKFIGARHEGT